MAVKIITKPEHTINQHLNNKKAYDQYGLRPSLTTPFFVRAKETCSMLEVDLKYVDQCSNRNTCITNMEVSIDITMLALPRDRAHSNKSRVGRNLKRKLPGLHPNIHGRIKNGGESRVVTSGENKGNRLPRPFSIYNAEAEEINTSISITRNTIQLKKVILSDLLSFLTALDGMRKIYNPKVGRLMNQIHREKEHLILMWVPGHAGIQGNEKADQHVKMAQQGKTDKNYKTVPEDWKNWIREKQEGIRQAEWTSSDYPMATVKPRIKKNNGAPTLTRRDQVIISRLRMGYIRLNHCYRVDLNPSPECGDCGARLTVDHLLWNCPKKHFPGMRTTFED
jgi:hypothetical protein